MRTLKQILKILIISTILLAGFSSYGEVTDGNLGLSNQGLGGVPVVSERHIDDMTLEELEAYTEYLKETGQLNLNQEGRQKYATRDGKIYNSKVDVKVACDPRDGLFYLDVYQDGNHLHRFLTSPGALSTPTKPFKRKSPYGHTNMHVTSNRTSYPGIKMPFVLWIAGGIATHGSNAVTGKPASHGCLRLTTPDAETLYNLALDVGLKNVKFDVNLNYNCKDRILSDPRFLPRQKPKRIQAQGDGNSAWSTTVTTTPQSAY